MSLVDKLRALRNLPDDTDLLVILGKSPECRVMVSARDITIGDETISLADARRAMADNPPARQVVIGDL